MILILILSKGVETAYRVLKEIEIEGWDRRQKWKKQSRWKPVTITQIHMW